MKKYRILKITQPTQKDVYCPQYYDKVGQCWTYCEKVDCGYYHVTTTKIEFDNLKEAKKYIQEQQLKDIPESSEVVWESE